jgi:hypothetical protein
MRWLFQPGGGVLVMFFVAIIILTMIVVVVSMLVVMLMTFLVMMLRVLTVVMPGCRVVLAVMMFAVLVFALLVFAVLVFAVLGVLVIGEGGGLRRLGVGVLDDVALHAVVMAAAAGIAVARTAAAGTVLVLFLGLAMGALVGLDQGLTVGDRDLIVVGMDFAERQEAVAVAAIFDKGGLQGRFYPRNLGEVDIAAQLLAVGGFEIKFFDAIATDHDDPGLFRMGGIDQHLVGHFGTLGGGGRVGPRARQARSGDATVHLIRG